MVVSRFRALNLKNQWSLFHSLQATHFPAHRVDTAPQAWQTNWFFDGFAMMWAVKKTGTLRLSEDAEREGIDFHEHGSSAYHPESAYMGSSR